MLEAASTISNLFGLGGPDIGQQRHEEIMKSFDRVFDRFDLVDERLKALLSGQEQILKNQETTYKKLIELSQEVSQNHLEVMDKLREIQGDVILNRMVMMSGIRSDYSNCLTFSDIVSTDKNIIPSFKSFDKWWVSHSSASGSCETRYINIYDVIGEKDFLPQFRIDANENSQNYEQKKVLIEAYTLSLKIIAAMIEKNDILKPGLTEAAVFFPARRMSDWDTKIRTISFLQEADLPKYKLKPYPVEPNIVSFHCKNLLNFHLYFLLMNPYTKSPYNFSDFMDPGKNHSEKGRNALIDALDLINQAIAQQNLYSGDILFSLVDEIITKHDTTKSQLYNDALKLININSLMTRNFLTYKFRKDLLAGGDKNFTAYMMAKNLAERDGDFSPLQSLVSYPWEFVLTEKSIVGSNDEGVKTKEASIKLGNRQYVLPSVSDLKDNKIEQTPDFENLLVIREGIYRELASYDVYKRFDNKQIKSLNAMMIYK
jgi:hypothetical protein